MSSTLPIHICALPATVQGGVNKLQQHLDHMLDEGDPMDCLMKAKDNIEQNCQEIDRNGRIQSL